MENEIPAAQDSDRYHGHDWNNHLQSETDQEYLKRTYPIPGEGSARETPAHNETS